MQSYTYESNFTTEFEAVPAKRKTNNNINVVYLHGLCSDPWGKKPETVKALCAELDIGFFRLELIGHGSDIADYEKADIDLWKAQVKEFINTFVGDNVILIGSSIGGWLALLLAKEMPNVVKGVIGLAAAADVTKDFDDANLQKKLQEFGKIEFLTNDFNYVITKQFIDSGDANLLLNAPINVYCSVQLIQGGQDKSFDWHKVLKIAELLQSEDVAVKVIKKATHRLNDEQSLSELKNSLVYLASLSSKS